MLASAGLRVLRVGAVAKDRFVLPGLVDLPVAALADAYENGLERALQG